MGCNSCRNATPEYQSNFRDSLADWIDVVGHESADELFSQWIIPVDKIHVYKDHLWQYSQKVLDDFSLIQCIKNPTIRHAVMVLIFTLSAFHGGQLDEIDLVVVREFPFIKLDELKLTHAEIQFYKIYIHYMEQIKQIQKDLEDRRSLLSVKLAELNKVMTEIVDPCQLKIYTRNQNLIFQTTQLSNSLSEEINARMDSIYEAIVEVIGNTDQVRRIGATAKSEGVFDFIGILQKFWPVPSEIRVDYMNGN